MLRITLIASFLCLSAAKAQSTQVDNDRAKVSFVFLDGDVEGSISGFVFNGRIDTNDLTLSEIKGSVETKSLDTNNWLRSRHLRSKKYFAVKDYPRLQFVGESIERGIHGYTLTGQLTIKGITNEVSLDLRQEVDELTVSGMINTQDFDIDIHDEVDRNRVKFTVVLPLTGN
ncbi:YceI family protein [Aureitalea marina]|uniref:YceI family protein n=1 Tax=Aureitalea marina TaxID=930804 RepID=UPI000CF20DAE|nr:YceI family protein [Aureitalea marina]